MDRRVGGAVVVLFLLFLAGVSPFSCARRRPVKVDSGHQLVMGTFARVVVVARSRDVGLECIRAAMAEINRVDELMSDYKGDSEISRVNKHGAERAIQVSESTYEVLARSIEFGRLTEGAFDVTVGPLMVLFGEAERTGVAPTAEQIAEAKAKVGFEKLILDGRKMTAQFTVEGMRLDLGGIAKGYAIDKAIEAARRGGALGSMVDIGGDIRCFGSPPEGREHWVIAVQDPNGIAPGTSGGRLLMKLKIADAAVATSGDYQQFVMIEGKRRSHIMDGKTGTSAEGLASVTVIADNATDADALATSVSVMGAEKGLALIENLPEIEAILITSSPEYEIMKTAGAGRYVIRE